MLATREVRVTKLSDAKIDNELMRAIIGDLNGATRHLVHIQQAVIIY